MSKSLKFSLVFYAAVAVLFGLPLLAAPGRFLGFFGWAPVDPLISRMLGAALMGMGYGAYRAWQRNSPEEAQALVRVITTFCSLAVLGLLRNMLGAGWPFMVWFVLGLFVLFAALFFYHWLRLARRK